jgi:hypothetical protein
MESFIAIEYLNMILEVFNICFVSIIAFQSVGASTQLFERAGTSRPAEAGQRITPAGVAGIFVPLGSDVAFARHRRLVVCEKAQRHLLAVCLGLYLFCAFCFLLFS